MQYLAASASPRDRLIFSDPTNYSVTMNMAHDEHIIMYNLIMST